MWDYIIYIAVIIVIGVALCYFFNLEKAKQLEMVQQWLLLAVIEAEKALGNGTGQLKLRFVYDMFLTKFKFLSKLISFEQFSILVDQALDVMRTMISNNKQIQDYIKKE
jgi:hypothetical protein